MDKLYTAKDVESILAKGGQLPAGARLTPAAKDILRDKGMKDTYAAKASVGGKKEYIIPDPVFTWDPAKEPKTDAEIQAYFNSPKINALKVLICDLGRRSYNKNYNDGNGGNFSVRVGENIVLCSPTMISKGFMTPEDMCFVDMNGVQLAGTRKRTSEVLAHLAIMKLQPLCKACCHAHPPHATAYALAGKTPISCVNPEAEIFIGQVGLADYGTPGTQTMADAVGKVGVKHDCIFMVNHGVMTWAADIETAFWKMENVEAHCYTTMMAANIGQGPKQFTVAQASDLLKIRKALGMVEQFTEADLKECNLSDSVQERAGCICSNGKNDASAFGVGCSGGSSFNTDAEKSVEQITKMILAELKKKK